MVSLCDEVMPSDIWFISIMTNLLSTGFEPSNVYELSSSLQSAELESTIQFLAWLAKMNVLRVL